MIDGLGRLGIRCEPRDNGKIINVSGMDGQIPALEADLFCANSGTTIRFLTALAALGHGRFRLDGVERMRARPIADLLDGLNQLGCHAQSENGNGCPPVILHANGLRGGNASLRGNISSQFLSAILMAAPAAVAPVQIAIVGRLVSQPYVRMTMTVMRAFGVSVEASADLRHFATDAPQRYVACEYSIEPDASAASYFWAAAAITGGEVTVSGLLRDSLQGDVAFVDCLQKMGCELRQDADGITVIGRSLRGIDVDMNAISDTVQTLAVVALIAEGPTIIRKVGHIRHKETDRITALATELRKLGARVEEAYDGLTIEPGMPKAVSIDTYNDHRMAMSFALAGLRIPGIRINDPQCVGKTYPAFFDDLASAGTASHREL
jgi:3-phosphoshikimate 1-carboxyvinyltransferase